MIERKQNKLRISFRPFSQVLQAKHNNFGFLRFFLASVVVFHHVYPLGGYGANDPVAKLLQNQEDLGSLAVLSFFIISGFLVTQSFIYSSSAISYGIKRCLRIFPAFWLCLLVTAFVFAPIVYYVQNHNFNHLFQHQDSPIQYIKHDFLLFMHQYTIDGLLKQNPFKFVFDGSLWTLILEAKGYVLLGIFGAIGIVKKNRVFVLLFFLALLAIFLFNIHVPKPHNALLHFFLDPSVFTYLTYFFAGVVFYLFSKKIPYHNNIFIAAILITIIAAFFHLFHQILPITAPYIIFWLANALPFQHFTKYGDFSYGMYIYAFPVQQLLTFFHYNANFFIYLVLSLVISFFFAVGSWYVIEQRCLDLKKTVVVKFR